MRGLAARTMGDLMDGKLMVPVPAVVSAWYLVPGALAADDAGRLAVETVDDVSRALLEHPDSGLEAEVSSTVTDGDAFRRPDFAGDRHLVSFRLTYRTGIAPLHEWIGRELAAGLASELAAGAVADTAGGQWISVDEALASLHEKEDGCLRLSDWVRVEAVPDRLKRTVALQTVGMRRYGLPELRAAHVPSWLGEGWSVALTGLAWQVREDLCDAVYDAAPAGQSPLRAAAPAAFEISDEPRLTADDVASAYCLRGVSDPLSNVVGLRLDAGEAGPFLTVRPPRDWEWSPQSFYESVAEGALKPVLKAARVFDDLVTGNVDLEEFAARF